MDKRRQLEKSIEYGQKRKVKRLDRRKLREKALRQVDKFDILLKSTLLIKTPVINLAIHRVKKEINENIDEGDFITDNCDHAVFNDNVNVNNTEVDNRSSICVQAEDDNYSSVNDAANDVNAHDSSSESDSDQCEQLSQLQIHNYTNISTLDYCEDLTSFLRKTNSNKSASTLLLKMIKSFLPLPNNVPSTLDELLLLLNVENLFTKRSICISCKAYLNYNETHCLLCQCKDDKIIANVYNIDVERILKKMLERLAPVIQEQKHQIYNNDDQEKTNDISFCRLYRQLLEQNSQCNLISLLLHLDGVGLTKSTQLKLWLFSGSIIELPPKIRSKRYNMVPLSLWIGYSEPIADIWLRPIVNQLAYVKKQDIVVNGTNYHVKIYGITGDCPALKKILNFVGHGGYDCCWFCHIRGQYNDRKVQYYYERSSQLRDAKRYLDESNEAQSTQSRINGHLGKSIIQSLVDIPLPYSIVIDYLHVTLLGHVKAISLAIYQALKPLQRSLLNNQLKSQRFPHFFNRKMRAFTEFANIKSTELRNLLFYGLLPNLQGVLSLDKLAHLALYVCAIRLFHGPKLLGDETGEVAHHLFLQFYEDHELFYNGLQNYVLHLHVHYLQMYKNHGSLCNIGCFAQEDFIGYISSGHHGTRYYGELMTHYYNMDFSIQNRKQSSIVLDGPKDQVNQCPEEVEYLHEIHASLCGTCDQINSCITIYRRYIIHKQMFHSLIYEKRQQSVSYFVQYLFNNDVKQIKFGIIKYFFTYSTRGYAVIQRHAIKLPYSDCFKMSKYYNVLKKPLNTLFFLLELYHEQIDLIPVEWISNHCIVVEMKSSLFVTPIVSYNEHD